MSHQLQKSIGSDVLQLLQCPPAKDLGLHLGRPNPGSGDFLGLSLASRVSPMDSQYFALGPQFLYIQTMGDHANAAV